MSRAKQASKAERRSKTVPVLGAAGLSLTLASGAYGASSTPAADVLSRNAGVVSLATFYVFDKEGAGTFRAGGRPIKVTGCCEFACLAGQAAESNAYSPPVYSPPVPRPIRPTHRSVRKKR
jgi:hypothetical protein